MTQLVRYPSLPLPVTRSNLFPLLAGFTPGVGACGTLSSSTDPVVSVSSALFDSYPGQASTNPNDNPICGRTIQITYNKIRTVNVTVVDRCEDCDEWDVNLSPTSFADLAEVGEGRLEDVKVSFDASNVLFTVRVD